MLKLRQHYFPIHNDFQTHSWDQLRLPIARLAFPVQSLSKEQRCSKRFSGQDCIRLPVAIYFF